MAVWGPKMGRFWWRFAVFKAIMSEVDLVNIELADRTSEKTDHHLLLASGSSKMAADFLIKVAALGVNMGRFWW